MAHPKKFLGGPWPTQNTVWRPPCIADTDTFVYDFSTTGDIHRRISGNTAVRYTAVTGTYSYTTVKKPLAYERHSHFKKK
jgi:hypothetical protein